MKKVITLIISAIIICSGLTVSADSNYKEYLYNTEGESIQAPASYKVDKVIYGNEATGTKFNKPTDIACDDNGDIYVLDSGNDRIVVLDKNYAGKTIISNLNCNGEAISLAQATGLFITKQNIFVADKGTGLIYRINKENGLAEKIITFKPQPIVDDEFTFKPNNITVDDSGIIQVQAEGCYNGLITLDADGNMIGYFSANTIQASVSVITAQFWRKIFSDEQQNSIEQVIPVEYSGITMDKDGFVYTTTAQTETSTMEIKKLNPYGNNILGYNDKFANYKLANGDYGDLRELYQKGQYVDTSFNDIFVDDEGFVFALDTTRGRVFQYDQSSRLVSIFGGIGDQSGTFSLPTGICGHNDKILVLDESKNSFTVFAPNKIVKDIRKALILDEKCDYIGAAKYWKKVYRQNANYSLALSGLGKAEYKAGNIKKAMQYFKRADDRTNYDIAYTSYRTTYIRNNFAVIGCVLIGIIVLIVVACYVYKRIRRRKI